MPRLQDRKRLPEHTPDLEVDRLVRYLPLRLLDRVNTHKVPYICALNTFKLSDVLLQEYAGFTACNLSAPARKITLAGNPLSRSSK